MRWLPAVLVALLVATGLAALRGEAAAHAQLDTSSPAADALLAIPPRELILTFTEPVDLDGITVTAVDELGNPIALGLPAYISGSDRQVRVPSSDFSIGAYTVSWSNRSATDGHTLSGSFAFRVGGTDRAPAAATTEGERPPFWAVLTRWATFLGLAPAIGLLMVAWSSRRNRLAIGGALVAVAATLLDPVLLSLDPPQSAIAGSVAAAIRSEPNGWWIRVAGLTALLVFLVIAEIRQYDIHRVIAAAGLVSLAGLALTSHSAGRESLAWLGAGVAFIHYAGVAIWVGALAMIVLGPRTYRFTELLRFSRRAFILVPIAIVAGIINAGLIFPNLETIRSTDYGRAIIIKVVIVAVVLALAGWHHLRVRSLADDFPNPVQATMRVELLLIALVVAVAATMAMLAPPKAATGELDRLDLAMPTVNQATSQQIFVRLTVDPARTGSNELLAYATDGPPLVIQTDASGAPKRVDLPPMTDIQAISVLLESLDLPVAPRRIDLIPVGDGTFRSEGVNLSADGWWQATVSVRRTGVAQDAQALFIVRTPDPNVSGFAESRASGNDANAEALYVAARDRLAGVEWATFTEDLSGGNGGVEISEQVWSNGGFAITTPTLQLIRLGGQRYFKDQSNVWRVTADSEPEGPEAWMRELDGATDFVLGNAQDLDGRHVQVIHFFVPGTYLAPAYYTWWINTETGAVEQVAMISRSHYMIRRYDWSAPPPPIVAPVDE